ncbi:UDP-N-acetylmuramate--L-alanine ligase [Parvibaculum sp.]|uniref:UDP-N-acetylmuramate--L-alanine ligase n=1 Tax=Parvibaculum sp. TaxID=2024848 RepID=UPI003297B2C8
MLPAKIHLVGIGGSGMASIAQYLLASGRTVSGSDRARTAITDELARDGARIAQGHDEALLDGAELVVVSDAIPPGNVELEGAHSRGIPVMRRAECLNLLREDRRAIMVAGSHGKSTTSAMIACILDEAGLDPGFALGADVPCLDGKRARTGDGGLFVAEACEAFRNLDALTAHIAIITNVDDEHVNHYASQTALEEAFTSFARRARSVIASGEDAGVARLGLQESKVTWFGLDSGCAVSAVPWPAPFAPLVNGVQFPPIALRQPGDHMRRNALAAIAACDLLGVAPEAIARGLARFTGAARRWQELGEVPGIRIVDDYAHHPAEISATLRAARADAPERRLVAAFQPLLHSRVQRLENEFAESLALADRVLLLDVDGDGESARSAGSAAIASGLRERGIAVIQREDAESLVAHIRGDLRDGDFLVVMGGPGMSGTAERLHQRLAASPPCPVEALEEAPSPAISHAPQHWGQRIAQSWRPQSFAALFRARVRAQPDAPALLGRDGTLSYAELDQKSDELAAGLAAKGMTGTVIGVALPLGAELVITLLGVMKAQCTYLPLDLTLPEARRTYMLKQAGAAAMIADEGATAGIPVFSIAALRAIGGVVPPAPRGDQGAYICFTSGSTGYPKGIQTSHMALAALLRDTVKRFEIRPGDRMLLNTSIGFDVSLAEICSTLSGGGALAAAGARPLAGEPLADTLEQLGTTHLSITPSLLASARPRALPQLRCIIAAGEPCPPKLVADWGQGRRFFNAYGPTEATIYATAALCEPGGEITIGTNLHHVEAHVLDEAMQPVATGELGELCLSGPGVSAGYIGMPDETARRFVQTTIGRSRVRLYRTGDMVRRGSDGILRFIGRADTQVKINGVRIELNEIERVVLREEGIADAAVCLTKAPRPALVCFVQAASDSTPDLTALSKRLSEWLPESALPSRIQLVPDIPLTPSGKKDRQKLIAKHGSRTITRAPEYWPPLNKTEKRLARLWKEALGLTKPVGRLDRFSALGGDSLASLMLILLVEERFGVNVPPGYFGRIGALPQMATQLDELLWHHDGAADGGKGFTASRIYRRMRDLCGHWPGTRLSPEHLISSLGSPGAPLDLFLCCQMEQEFKALAARLSPAFRVHGMRSGHLVIDNGPGDIRQLASRYAEEIAALSPRGPVILAGVCQGGAIARSIAELLVAEGRPVPLLVLIEAGRPQPYEGRVALICAEDSFINPLRPGGQGLAPYEAAMPGGVSIDLIPGIHGAACVEPAVQFLAHHLTRRVEAVLGRSVVEA